MRERGKDIEHMTGAGIKPGLPEYVVSPLSGELPRRPGQIFIYILPLSKQTINQLDLMVHTGKCSLKALHQEGSI